MRAAGVDSEGATGVTRRCVCAGARRLHRANCGLARVCGARVVRERAREGAEGKRRGLYIILRVHVGAALEERLHDVQMPVLGGADERRVFSLP